MIFRRVKAHIEKENWFAVGVDLFIVVVGVFIGIQVANWNETRLSEAQSEMFSQRLRADLQVEAWDFEFTVEYYTDVLQNTKRVVSDLEGEKALSELDLIINAYRATQYRLVARTRSTFDELLSTGRIYLIKDAALRETAMHVYNYPLYDITLDRGSTSKYREAFRMHIPSSVQTKLSKKCGDRFVKPNDYVNIVDSLDYSCDPQLSKTEIDRAVAIIRDREKILPLLRLRKTELESVLYNSAVAFPKVRKNLETLRMGDL